MSSLPKRDEMVKAGTIRVMSELLPNGLRLSCGALKKIHSLIYARASFKRLLGGEFTEHDCPVSWCRRETESWPRSTHPLRRRT